MNVSFGGVERNGPMFGMSIGQTACCLAAVTVFVTGMWTVRSVPGFFLVLLLASGTAAAGLWPCGGLTPAEWAVRVAAAGARRVVGRHMWISAEPFVDVDPPRQFRTISLTSTEVRGGEVGVLVEKKGAREIHSAVVAVEGTSFGLASQGDRDRRIEQWGALVASLGESLVARLQVSARTVPADPRALQTFFDGNRTAGADPAWAAGYQTELDKVAGANVDTELSVVVVIDHRKRGVSAAVRHLGGGSCGRLALIAAEVDRIQEQLAAADIAVRHVLSPRQLADAVRSTLDPYVEEQGGSMWPSAVVDNFGTARVDGAVHACFHVAGWPARQVEGGFLQPLLCRSLKAGYVRTFSLIIEPAHPDTALRKVERARLAEDVELEGRKRSGFAVTARRRMSLEALGRREQELVEGATDCRFAGVVVVSAPDTDALTVGVAEVTRLAHASHLRLRRAHGLQATMLGVALPLGRGFERKRLT
jgi:hypothetical protein